MKIKTNKLTKEQVNAQVALLVAYFDEYIGGIDDEYNLEWLIVETDINFKVIFKWTYEVVQKCVDRETNSFESTEKQTEDYFVWLKGEPYKKLFTYVEDALNTVIKDKINYESL